MLKRAIGQFLFFTLSVIFWTGILVLSKTPSVFAYYLDEEQSSGNFFKAGNLDFSLSSSQNFQPGSICPSETSSRQIEISNQGNPLNYKIETTEISGDLCNYIYLEANLNGGTVECSGNLVGFSCQEFFIDASMSQQWQFQAKLIEGAPENSVCNFKFYFFGRQLYLENGGFYDEEEIENTITSGICGIKVLINKVYYDVDCSHGLESTPNNEWIELYNPNNFVVDISNWQICDNSNCDVIPSFLLPANGFALISGSANTWQYWETIPPQVIKIVLPDGKIGDGLANSADMVLLKDNIGKIVDQMNWGTPSNSWQNYNSQLWNPGLNPSGDGGIAARVPTGLDTDSKSDWKNLNLPQITVTYPMGGGWVCNQNVVLRWTATNPNGPDNDLKIDLFYIRDLDENGIISSGDATTIIAQDLANTGLYQWQVSPCYWGYVWIKAVAKGPENFMISNSDLSERVWEPPTADDLVLPDNSQEDVIEEGQTDNEVSEPESEELDELNEGEFKAEDNGTENNQEGDILQSENENLNGTGEIAKEEIEGTGSENSENENFSDNHLQNPLSEENQLEPDLFPSDNLEEIDSIL